MSINKSIKSNSNHKTFGITTFHSVAIEKPLNDDDVFSMFNIYFMFASNEYLKLYSRYFRNPYPYYNFRIILTKCNLEDKVFFFA